MGNKTLAITAIVLSNLVMSTNASATPFPGPDTFGYIGSEIDSNLRNISSTGTLLGISSSDDSTSAVALGFNFDFYGNTYSDAHVSSNGFIGFNSSPDNGCCSGDIIGDSIVQDVDNLVAALWEDLNPASGGNIYAQTIGNEFIVGFYGVNHFGTPAPVTFEMILHSVTNDIELQYGNVTEVGGNHTIGISNIGDTDALALLNSSNPISGFSNRGFCIGYPGGNGCGGDVPAPVPVPATLALFGLGLAGLGWSKRKKS